MFCAVAIAFDDEGSAAVPFPPGSFCIDFLLSTFLSSAEVAGLCVPATGEVEPPEDVLEGLLPISRVRGETSMKDRMQSSLYQQREEQSSKIHGMHDEGCKDVEHCWTIID